MRVIVMDDGVSPLFTEASSLLNVANEQFVLLSSEDTDGGANDSDGVADGVIRITGGLAAPVSADAEGMPQTNSVLAALVKPSWFGCACTVIPAMPC